MEMIEVRCPYCGNKCSFPVAMAGARGLCACGHSVRIAPAGPHASSTETGVSPPARTAQAHPSPLASVDEQRIREAYELAAELLGVGKGIAEVRLQLSNRGIREDLADAIIDHVVRNRRRPAVRATGGSLGLQALGTIVFLAGIGLVIGNVTGLFPTFPFAGYLTMTAGGAILAAGSPSSRLPLRPTEVASTVRSKSSTRSLPVIDFLLGAGVLLALAIIITLALPSVYIGTSTQWGGQSALAGLVTFCVITLVRREPRRPSTPSPESQLSDATRKSDLPKSPKVRGGLVPLAIAVAVIAVGLPTFRWLDSMLHDNDLWQTAETAWNQHHATTEVHMYLADPLVVRHRHEAEKLLCAYDDRLYSEAEELSKRAHMVSLVRKYIADPDGKRHREEAQAMINSYYDEAVERLKGLANGKTDLSPEPFRAFLALIEALKQARSPVVTVGFRETHDLQPVTALERSVETAIYQQRLKEHPELAGIAATGKDGSAILPTGDTFTSEQCRRREDVILERLRASTEKILGNDLLTIERAPEGEKGVIEVAYHSHASGGLYNYTKEEKMLGVSTGKREAGLLRSYKTDWEITIHPPGTEDSISFHLTSSPQPNLNYQSERSDPDWAIYAVILCSGTYDLSDRLIRSFALDPPPEPDTFTFAQATAGLGQDVSPPRRSAPEVHTSEVDATESYDRGCRFQSQGDRLRAQGKDPSEAYAKALVEYERAISLDPQHAEATTNQAIVHWSLGDWQASQGKDPNAMYSKALAAFDKAISLNPAVWQAHNGKGMLLEQLQRLDDGIAAYEAGLRACPGQPQLEVHLDAARAARKAASPALRELAEAAKALDRGDYTAAGTAYDAGLQAFDAEFSALSEADRSARLADPSLTAALQKAHYNLARICSLAGDGKDGPNAAAKPNVPAVVARLREKAFRHLRQAIDLGYADAARLVAEPDLAPLHEDPRWTDVVKRLTSK